MRLSFLLGLLAVTACAPYADSEAEAQAVTLEEALPYCTAPGYLPVGAQPCLVPEHRGTHVLQADELAELYGTRLGPDKRVAAVATVRYVTSALVTSRSDVTMAQDVLRRMQMHAPPLRGCHAKLPEGDRCVTIAEEPMADLCETVFLCDSEPAAPSLADLDRQYRLMHPVALVMRIDMGGFCGAGGGETTMDMPEGDVDVSPDMPIDVLTDEPFDPNGLPECPPEVMALNEAFRLLGVRPQASR